MFQLSLRLTTIAQMVPCNTILADIGTDHAELPVYLVYHNICPFAIASDCSRNALLGAREKVVKYHLEDKVFLRCGDGLTCLDDHEIQTVVIAGMGGIKILEILNHDLSKTRKISKVICQPMRDSSKVQQWLVENGFIVQVEYVTEHQKTYAIISGQQDPYKSSLVHGKTL